MDIGIPATRGRTRASADCPGMEIEILIYDGFDDLDAFGPFEVLTGAGVDTRLVTVEPRDVVVSSGGARIVPHGVVGDPDLVLVPGGNWSSRAPQGAWAEAHTGAIGAAMRRRLESGRRIGSICTGGMILAHEGLLRGRPAITHHDAIEELEAYGADVQHGRRFVDDGDIVTAGGVTSGIDLALYIVENEVGAARGGQGGGGDRMDMGDALKLPETELAHAALAWAREIEPEYLLNHSVRSYLFARDVAPGSVEYDDELLFLATVLHDVGLTPEGGGEQRFEVDGADAAVRFLATRGLSEERAEIVWDAIALHTSIGIANRKRPEVALAYAGIGIDVSKRGAERLAPGFAESVFEAYPRLGCKRELLEAVIHVSHANPARKAPPLTFPGEILRLRHPEDVPRWDQLVAWGD